jgi:signal peptidase II
MTQIKSKYWLALSLSITLLDQISKQIIIQCLYPGQSIAVLSWLNLQLVYNTGIAFGLFAQATDWQHAVLILLNITLSAWMLRQLYNQKAPLLPNKLAYTALSLALGGALGNLCDRLFQGKVTDFIDFHIGVWHFAIFNLADSAVCLAAVLWLLAHLRLSSQ